MSKSKKTNNKIRLIPLKIDPAVIFIFIVLLSFSMRKINLANKILLRYYANTNKMHRTIVKEGPLVFIINVIAMEIILAVLLYIASFLQNYEMLYRNRGFDALLRYDLFLIVTFSALQLFYVSTLFLEWYFSLKALQ